MEGHKCKMCIQISDVDRILLAVTELNDADNDVVLSKSGGEIVNVATGKGSRYSDVKVSTSSKCGYAAMRSSHRFFRGRGYR